MAKLMKTERWDAAKGKWVGVEFSNLKKGDRMRQAYPDRPGSFKEHKGCKEFTVLSDPEFKNGHWQVETEGEK